MKKICFLLTIAFCLVVCAVSCADIIEVNEDGSITLYLDLMTDEELQTVIDDLQIRLNDRKGITKPKETANPTTQEMSPFPITHTFDNGYILRIDDYAVTYDNRLMLYYSFIHNKEKPTNFDVNDTPYQTGIELEDKYTSEDIDSYMRKSLAGTETHVTKTYQLIDDSPITVYIEPWSSREKAPFVCTFSLDMDRAKIGYWNDEQKVLHFRYDCPDLPRYRGVIYGTSEQAIDAGVSSYHKTCAEGYVEN